MLKPTLIVLAVVSGLALLSLATCDPGLQMRAHRAEVVKVCRDGTQIVRDPASGRYLALGRAWMSDLAPGVDPYAICERR